MHQEQHLRVFACHQFPWQSTVEIEVLLHLQSPDSITLHITTLKTFHSSTNILLPRNFSLCSSGCAVHFCMHLLVLRFRSYYNFWLSLVLLKDYTNMPMFHRQLKLCHWKCWCVRNSNNTTSSGDKYWIDKRRYSKSKCSQSENLSRLKSTIPPTILFSKPLAFFSPHKKQLHKTISRQ